MDNDVPIVGGDTSEVGGVGTLELGTVSTTIDFIEISRPYLTIKAELDLNMLFTPQLEELRKLATFSIGLVLQETSLTLQLVDSGPDPFFRDPDRPVLYLRLWCHGVRDPLTLRRSQFSGSYDCTTADARSKLIKIIDSVLTSRLG